MQYANVRGQNGFHRVKVAGELQWQGFDFIAHRDLDDSKRWAVSELSTGYKVCDGEARVIDVIEEARAILKEKSGGPVSWRIAELLEANGRANPSQPDLTEGGDQE